MALLPSTIFLKTRFFDSSDLCRYYRYPDNFSTFQGTIQSSLRAFCCRCRVRGSKSHTSSGLPTTQVEDCRPTTQVEDCRSARLWLIPHPLGFLFELPREAAQEELLTRVRLLVSGSSTQALPTLQPSQTRHSLSHLDHYVLQRIMAFCSGASLCRLRSTNRSWQRLDLEAHFARLIRVEFGVELSVMRRGRSPASSRSIYLSLCAARKKVFTDIGVPQGLVDVLRTGLRIPRFYQ